MDLRPGYKRTEVGVIPEDWDAVRLGDLLEFRNGVNAEKYAYGAGIPFINVLEVITKSHLLQSDIPGRVSLPQSTIESYSVRRGDVVFNRTSETQEEVGLAAVYTGEQTVVFGGFVIRGRARRNGMDVEYSGYGLRAHAVRAQVVARGQGAIRANIGQVDLKQVLVALPPLAEQRAIARSLSDCDGLLSALDGLIAKKGELKHAAMQQLIAGKTRLPGFSEEWAHGPFEALFTNINVKQQQVQASEYRSSGTFPVVDQGKRLIAGYSNLSEKLFRCPPDGVIVFGDHTRIVKFVDFDFIVGADGTQILAAKPGHSARFLAYQLQLRELPSSGYSRHYKFVKMLTFAVPSLPEQHAITTVLSDMDAEIAALEARRDKTRALKQAMMQELLTGRTRLV